ncbi:MAG TPA: hypothetical protein VFJ58_10115 [Armatimonadota bacterium]|nr:hypothetical protein [Armatimonadota bacterium]
MNQSFALEGPGAKVAITVIDYERATANNANDANWLRCHLIVDLSEVTARLEIALQT